MTDTQWLLNFLLSHSESEGLVEFKHNFDPEKFWKNISALANNAVIKGYEFCYIVYGIEDQTKKILGTDFDPDIKKIWNQPLEIWTQTKITPKTNIRFFKISTDGWLALQQNALEKKVAIVEIGSAQSIPVKFKDIAYIKIGESTTELKNYPSLEQKIWNNEKNRNFEKEKILKWLDIHQIIKLLDYDKYLRLTKQELPTETKWIIEKMIQEKFVIVEDDWTYSITSLWALLLANDLNDFDFIRSKAIRVIVYKGNSKLERSHDFEYSQGYAIVFEWLMNDLISIVGSNEIITQSLRIDNKKYPPLALREFVVNSLIHQDFSISWQWPLIEVFENRVEITNPWAPLIDVERFIDHPSRSRNPYLSKKMRDFWFCEESGSGVDRALLQIELYQLPAPNFEKYDDYTKVTLFAGKPLSEMSDADKIRACYQHCVLMHLKWEGKMQNASLRERLNIPATNYPAASKIITLTLQAGKIKPHEKAKEYIPWWA